MSSLNAGPGEVVAAGPLGSALAGAKTETLVKTPALNVVRLAVPAGKEIPEHRAPGVITVHCLEGVVDLTAGGETRRLNAGQPLYLTPGTPHSLRGISDASVLVTILRG
jgi:quercetin dioxygenase-like cupin family protein